MGEIFFSKRIISLIYQKLNSDLQEKVIVTEGSEIWIVDSETKEWYLEYDSRNFLYYNKKFFDNFFSLFSCKDYSKIIQNWFENLGFGIVKGTSRKNSNSEFMIDKILKNKKTWTLQNRFGFSYSLVKKITSQKKILNKQNLQLKDFLTEDVEFYKILY